MIPPQDTSSKAHHAMLASLIESAERAEPGSVAQRGSLRLALLLAAGTVSPGFTGKDHEAEMGAILAGTGTPGDAMLDKKALERSFVTLKSDFARLDPGYTLQEAREYMICLSMSLAIAEMHSQKLAVSTSPKPVAVASSGLAAF